MPRHERPRAIILVSVSTPEQAQDKKQSLRTQERDLRAIAEQRGWDVIAVLKIPGFSRDYISWEECERDMLAANPPITAMRELRVMTEQRAYDIFMVRDADRFGRTQSLIMQIAETICIIRRLKIYSQIDNTLVEGEAARFWAAMTGLRSAGEMDKKRVYHDHGQDERAKQGFYENRTAWYHRTVYDPTTGKELRVEVKEEYRYIWDAVFEVLVNQRIGFPKVEFVLMEQGILDPETGKRFKPHTIHRLMYAQPSFWGHRARKIKPTRGEQHPRQGAWTFDPSQPPPEGVRVWRDVLPPIYTGEQASALIAELHRRKGMIGGRKPGKVSPFSGLLVCDYCHWPMIYQELRIYKTYRCTSSQRVWEGRQSCQAQLKSVQRHDVQAFVHDLIKQCADGDRIFEVFAPPKSDNNAEQLALIAGQIQELELEARRMVDRIAIVPEEMLGMHRDKMRSLNTSLNSLQAKHDRIKRELVNPSRIDQQEALKNIMEIGLEHFWQLPDAAIHQHLTRLFGSYRMIVSDGEVIGVKLIAPRVRTSRVP